MKRKIRCATRDVLLVFTADGDVYIEARCGDFDQSATIRLTPAAMRDLAAAIDDAQAAAKSERGDP
jgi:hypothetical protein